MSEGAWITLASTILGVCGMGIVAILRYIPARQNGDFVRKEVCNALHQAIGQQYADLKEDINELKKAIACLEKKILQNLSGGGKK